MAATNFTPIQLYRSSTAAAAPLAADLAAGELAINTTDEKLYFENASGTVKLLASSAATGGTFTTVTATTVVNGLGAVGTPSYTFTGDLNTGMWSPAADTIAFSEGGAEAMRINSAGNVGIGTTAPGYKLDVSATGNISGQFKTSGSINALFLADAGTTAESLYIGTVGNDFRVVTGSNEHVRVTSAGLVGIGTSTPGAKLEVSSTSAGATAEVLRLNNPGGGANTAAQIKFNAAGANYASITGGYGAAAPQMTFNLPSGAGNYVWQQASAESMRLDSSGNLGIGTSAPTGRLEVVGASATGNITTVRNTTATQFFIGGVSMLNAATANNFGVTVGTGVRDADGTDSFFTINKVNFDTTFVSELAYYDLSGEFWRFRTNNTERMRIDSSGNVGIGTSAPTTGSMSNLATLNAGIFITHRGSVSATTAVATTIAVGAGANNVTYIVSCTVAASDPVNYSAVAIVSGDAGTFRVTALQTAALMTISVSGTNIQATQASGGTQNILFCITRVS
jgi:hypothetical protein